MGGGGGERREWQSPKNSFYAGNPTHTQDINTKIRITFYYVERNYMYSAVVIKEMIDVSVHTAILDYDIIHMCIVSEISSK